MTFRETSVSETRILCRVKLTSDLDWGISEHLRFFVFNFFIILFCLVPCGRLSWLLVSFWAHVNIVVLYRIVYLSNLINGGNNWRTRDIAQTIFRWTVLGSFWACDTHRQINIPLNCGRWNSWNKNFKTQKIFVARGQWWLSLSLQQRLQLQKLLVICVTDNEN